MVSNVLGETRVAIHCPNNTPNRLVVTNAVPAPANTTQGEWDSALINRVVTWVLSPSSAKKMVIKVEKKTDRLAGDLLPGGLPKNLGSRL